jgi:SEC-C motif
MGTAAVRAWRGRIQPFPDGTYFSQVMAHLDADQDVRVGSAGRLLHPEQCHKQHEFFLAFSNRLTHSFEIVLLGFAGLQRPRVYAVSPEISRRAFPNHPHLRDDQLAPIDGKPLSALCVYLSSDQVLQRDDMELVHMLDYTSMFLAKHLVFAATCLLQRFYFDKPMETRCSDPDLSIAMLPRQVYDGIHAAFAWPYRTDVGAKSLSLQEQVEQFLKLPYWDALWPAKWVGSVAPHEAIDLLKEFDSDDECPCGSGVRYGDCHRREHELTVPVTELNRTQIRNRLIPRVSQSIGRSDGEKVIPTIATVSELDAR